MDNSSWIGGGVTFLLSVLGFKAKWIHTISKKVDDNRDELFRRLSDKVDKTDFINDRDRLLDSIGEVHKKIDFYRDSTERKIDDFNKTILELVKCSKRNNF